MTEAAAPRTGEAFTGRTVVALLVAALVIPVVDGLHRLGLPRGLPAILVVVSGLAFVAALLTVVAVVIALRAAPGSNLPAQ